MQLPYDACNAAYMVTCKAYNSYKVIKNEVGCGDDPVPKQEGTARRIESMQQSSATPKNQRCREGVAEDCCMLSILLAVPSCFNSFWHRGIPTSYFIFNDFYTCSTHFFSHKYGQHTVGSLDYMNAVARA